MNSYTLGILKRSFRLPWLAGIAGLVILGIAAAWLPPIISLAVLAVVGVVSLLAISPQWFMIVLLLLRSVADASQDLFTLFPGRWYSFNAAGLLNILVAGVGLFFLGRRFARGQRWLPTAPILIFGIFLFEMALSIPTSLDLGASVKTWARVAGYMGIALLACEVAQSEKSILNALRGVVIAALPPLIVGYYQALTGRGYYFIGYVGTPFVFRPQGTFGHPAMLASFLVIVTGLLLAAFLWKYPLFPRLVLLGLMAACLCLLMLTYARTEWIGGMVTLGLIAVLRDRRFLLVIAGVGLIFLLFVPTVQERLQGEQASESFQWRLTIWDASLAILQKPTVFGSGLDTSPILINKLLYNVDTPPHNDYLRTAIESGIAGLVIFLLLQAALLLHGWRVYWRAATLSRRVIGLTLFGIVMGGVVISISDNYFSYASVQWYTWAFVGLLATSFSSTPDWREKIGVNEGVAVVSEVI